MLSFMIQITVGGLALGVLYSLAAVGLVVVHKATRSVNFVHGAFIMLGAYGAWALGEYLMAPVWVVYTAVPLGVGIFAALLESIVLRPLRNNDQFTAIIATIFLGFALTEVARIFFSAEMLPVSSPVANWPPLDFGDVYILPDTLWVVVGAFLVTAVAIFLFSRARIGVGMRAMASNPRGAQLSGFDVDRTYAQAWFMGGFVAALAGVFIAPLQGVSPELAIGMLVPAFVAAVIGGLDSLAGAVIGGILLGLVETYAGVFGSGALQGAVSFIILVVVLLFRPGGIFKTRELRHV